MPAMGRWPERPVSRSTLAHVLRDRHYLGEVYYQGIWYPGRHEALIDDELFNRAQRVLDAHSGSGTRQRTHRHYLKGLLWCARCKHRFTVARAICDMPYLPAEEASHRT